MSRVWVSRRTDPADPPVGHMIVKPADEIVAAASAAAAGAIAAADGPTHILVADAVAAAVGTAVYEASHLTFQST